MWRAAFLLLLLPGCGQIDPYAREGAWRPRGSNEANLRIHVVDPNMLDRGVDDRRADGQVAGAAVQRYRTDRVKPLLASGVANIQPTGTGGAATGGAGATNGGR